LTDDFGLDLFEIIELIIVLEKRFGVDAETADEPNQIEFVGDLIRYIERYQWGETQTDRLIPISDSGFGVFNRRERSVKSHAVGHHGEGELHYRMSFEHSPFHYVPQQIKKLCCSFFVFHPIEIASLPWILSQHLKHVH
jgi:hypothetical protein